VSERLRVLVIAEAANPEWVSVPLVGWSHARALADVVSAHVVTQERNRLALERAGWKEGREFTALDSEALAAPMWKFDQTLRRLTGLGWTTTTALAAIPYYYFEHQLWRRFGDAIRRREFDVVHRLTPLSPTTPSVIAGRCRRAGVPFVWGPVNGGIPWPPGFSDVIRAEGEWLSYVRGAYRLLPGYGATRRDAAAIIVASRATLDDLSGYRDKCVYIPENAIDPERFGRWAPRAPATGPLRITFVGRLVPYKGADMLIEAVAPLARDGRAIVEIIGDGPQRQALERQIESEGLQGRISLAGWVRNEQLADRLAGAELFAFPSVREFGGGVVLEAMVQGVVPIVVDYGGPGELVTESTGFRVPIGTRESIVSGFRGILSELARDRSPLAAMSERARRRVEQLFTWKVKAEQVHQVYRWVLGRGPKPDFGLPLAGDEDRPPPSAAAVR
jgi:glycosyltransferase involved in cell wall biosynthesis